jgi:hypothetical protein
MQIVNNTKSSISFRFFDRNDGLCAVGFDEGDVASGQTLDYLIAGVGRAKVEIWDGAILLSPRLLGPTLVDNDYTVRAEPNGTVTVIQKLPLTGVGT